MRKVMRPRYYCEFCKKAGGSAYHIAKHERGCTRNIERICGMCEAAGIGAEQQGMQTLLAALAAGGLEELTKVAQTCPACILAAIVQDRMLNPIVNIAPDKDEGGWQDSREYIKFDFRAACKEFWHNVEIGREMRQEAERPGSSWEGLY